MKAPIASISLATALLVSAGALYQANSSQAEACAYLQSQADRAAQAPIRPESTGALGFTPMDQFNKVYAPACQPQDSKMDLFGALIGGVLAGLAVFGLGVSMRRIIRSTLKE